MIRIVKDCKVGIYDNCEYMASIYDDRIVVKSPYVRWTDNAGTLDTCRDRITDPKVILSIRAALADGAEASAWAEIGRKLDDQYLASCGKL